MMRGHIIALDTTAKTAEAMARAAGVKRFTYNWIVNEYNNRSAVGEYTNIDKLKKEFNSIKREKFPWIMDSPRDANSQPFANVKTAIKNFHASRTGKRKGRKMGPPQFKRKGVDDSFYVANDVFAVREENGHHIVRLPVIGDVRMREKLRWDGKIVNGKVFRRGKQWFISINVEVNARIAWTPKHDTVGVDLGLKTAVVVSDGKHADAPKPLRSALASLKRANRKLHRRKKGSKNRNKARIALAHIHQRVANVRKDFWHKTTTNLCRENQTVVIEDLDVMFMLRNRKLARAAADVAPGMLRPMMEYKSKVYGCELIIADKFFPSTQRCSGCGVVKTGDAKLTLGKRVFECTACGIVMDRDDNAAQNLKQYPRLAGNWSRKTQTPMDDHSSTWQADGPATEIVEVGTKPDAHECGQIRKQA